MVRPGPDAPWHMFYTGATDVRGETVQSTCLATSPDLVTWTRDPANPSCARTRAGTRCSARAGPARTGATRGSTPIPVATAGTCSSPPAARTGPDDDRGVVGAAWSPTCGAGQARPPRSAPGAGFGQLEVMQREVVDGRPVLLFSCLRPELSAARAATVATGGIWAVTAEPGGDAVRRRLRRAAPGRPVLRGQARARPGRRWVLLAFHHRVRTTRSSGRSATRCRWSMTPDGLRLG